MRACGACYYYQGDHQAGECYNRPPHSYTVNHGTIDGRPDLQTFGIRPPVRVDEYCSFFSHRNTNRADRSGAQKPPGV